MSQNMTHTITLKANDQTTVVFQRMGQSAQTAAAQIGSAGQRAAAGLNQQDAAAQKAAASTTKLGTASTAAARGISAIHGAASGAAFATFVGFLSQAANAAAEDEAAFVRLETAVSATGQSYNDFAGAIERRISAAQQLGFADDATADALATLTAQTQDAARAQELLGQTMDLARGKNISLSTAANIVGRVAAGNTGILSRYGIVLDENATATEALAELQQRFGGQAEAFAGTQAGAIARMQEGVDSFVESVGGALGPSQQFIALLPGITAGMQLAGGAAGILATRFTALAAAQTAVTATGGAAGMAGVLGAAAPIVGTLGAAALVAAPAIAAIAVAAHQAAEAQDEWNRSLAEREEFVAANAQGATPPGRATSETQQDLREIAEAFRTWNTVTTVAIGDTTVGLEQLEDMLYGLSTEGVADVLAFTEALGGVSPENIDQVAAKVAELSQFEAEAASARARHSMEWREQNNAFQADLQAIGQAASDGQGFLAAMYDTAIQKAQAAHDANIALARSLDPITQQGGPGLSSLYRSPTQQLNDAASLAAVSEASLAEQTAEATAKAEEHAAALSAERDAALQTADALIGTAESRAQDALRQVEAQEQYAERVTDINKNLADTLSGLEESYGDTVASIQQQRVEGEQHLAEQVRSINEARRNAAVEAEEAIADVAEQRQQVIADAAQRERDAQQQWQESQAQTAQRQADIRAQLQETTAQAAEQWQEANQRNIEQQRTIRTELTSAIRDVQRELRRSMAESDRDLQRIAQDHRTTMAGFATDEARIREDLQLVLNDPRATAEQKNAAELAAARALEDLAVRREEEEREHERSVGDARRSRHSAEEEAERRIADLRAQARKDQQAADEARAQAQEQYAEAVANANQQAQSQLASLEQQRQAAADQYRQTQADIAAQERQSLDALAQREQEILDQRAAKESDLAKQRRAAIEDNATRQQELDAAAAEAAQQYNEQAAEAQAAAAEQRAQAQEQFASQTQNNMTELQRLRAEGLITEEEYKRIYDDLIVVQQTSREIEHQRLLDAIDEIEIQQQLLDIEKQKLAARRKGNEEPPDPLDGPVPERALGGMSRYRTLVGETGSELAIRGNRMWEVGSRGPELINLASGTLIMPHGAAQARMRAEGMALGGHVSSGVPRAGANGRSGRATGAQIINHGTIIVQVKDEEIADAVARQLAGRSR